MPENTTNHPSKNMLVLHSYGIFHISCLFQVRQNVIYVDVLKQITQIIYIEKSLFGCWLVVWVLWHINLCRLFNTKSLFMIIILFQTIQFSINTLFKCKNQYSEGSIEGTLSGATTPGQSGPRSNDNEGVLHIPQSSSLSGTSLSECLVSYPGHSSGWSYPSVEVQPRGGLTPL